MRPSWRSGTGIRSSIGVVVAFQSLHWQHESADSERYWRPAESQDHHELSDMVHDPNERRSRIQMNTASGTMARS